MKADLSVQQRSTGNDTHTCAGNFRMNLLLDFDRIYNIYIPFCLSTWDRVPMALERKSEHLT